MDANEYWKLVARAREAAEDPNDIHEVAAQLKAILRTFDLERLKGAAVAYIKLSRAAYNWKLWGAAYVINGGCSDDGLDYFIGWLIGHGQEVYDNALANPDWLAGILTADDADSAECEDMLAAAGQAYKELTGSYDMGLDVFPLPALGPGWDFDDEAEMRKRYPRLCAMFF
jgi:Protein of unknown function (DUF4240)